MFDVKKFIGDHTPLCVCTLGIAIIGYLACHTVRWIINKCSHTKKIVRVSQPIIQSSQTQPPSSTDLSKDHWWTKITQTKEFDDFKKNWKNLTRSQAARREEAEKLKSLYKPTVYTGTDPKNQSLYQAPLGIVHNVPGNFGMWMSGVALVANYLTQKKKVEGLYVCETLESLSSRLNEIHLNPANQRYAFVVGTFSSGCRQYASFGFEPNFPQHKVTVCVEKKDGQLTIALLDAQPEPGFQEISPENLVGELWDGYDQRYRFNHQELVFRAICIACRNSKCKARLLHSQVLRERIYGCVAFALQDGLAFLRDPDFFDRITCSKEKTVKIDQNYEIEVITGLPAEYMIGVQSSTLIDEYRKKGGQFDQVLVGKKKTLQNYLDTYVVGVVDYNGVENKQNHYITKKSFEYLNLAVLSLRSLKPAEIEKILNRTLIK